jgi:hypothetical protein
MGNLIIRNDAIFLEGWQIEAAINTHLDLWPPVPKRTERPYLAKVCIPLEGVGEGVAFEDINAPAIGATILGLSIDDQLPWCKFVVKQRVIMPVNLAAEAEAIHLGLVSVSKFKRGEGVKLIRDYWNGRQTSEALTFDNGPRALFLGLQRVRQ